MKYILFYNIYISIHNIRYYNQEFTKQFKFLKNLDNNESDWDLINIVTKRRKEKRFERERYSSIFCNDDEMSPDFYSLSKPLQEKFVGLLSQLEIEPDISNYIKYLGLNRERRDYIAWLYKTLEFMDESTNDTKH